MAKPQLVPMPNEPPAPPAIPVPGPWAVSFSVPIPEVVRQPTRKPLPFGDYFDAYEGAAMDGHKPHFFIPCSFYHGQPGVKVEKVDPAYVRSKTRDQFNAWKKKAESREPLYLTVIPRDGKDEGSTALAAMLGIKAEPGVSVWILRSDGEAAPKA